MRQWLIDAFASGPFRGNAACIVEPLADWPAVSWMQAIAQQNNVGATAFLRRTENPTHFGLRWFTPAVEVPLCGHATLAAAHVLLAEIAETKGPLVFETEASGRLEVQRTGLGYEMALPAQSARLIPTPEGLAAALGVEPLEVWSGPYLVALLKNADEVRALAPKTSALREISLALEGQGNVGVAALAPASAAYDIIDRFFAPGYGIEEDAATGSLHAILAPIFQEKLARPQILFHQAFPGRGADFVAKVRGDKVLLMGMAVTIAESRFVMAPEPALTL